MKSVTGGKTFDLNRELILSAEEDYADLASLAHTVRNVLGPVGEEEIRSHTLGRVYELLSGGFLRAGIPTPEGGFEPWEGGLMDVMGRIEGEWLTLGRMPALGEIVWFDATDRGISYLESSPD